MSMYIPISVRITSRLVLPFMVVFGTLFLTILNYSDDLKAEPIARSKQTLPNIVDNITDIKTIRVIVNQEGVQVEDEEDKRHIEDALQWAGFTVVATDAHSYDATIYLHIKRTALGGWYSESGGWYLDRLENKTSFRYTGAQVTGTIDLEYMGERFTVSFDESDGVDSVIFKYLPPSGISKEHWEPYRADQKPDNAPFGRAYGSNELTRDTFLLLAKLGRIDSVITALLKARSGYSIYSIGGPILEALDALKSISERDNPIEKTLGKDWQDVLDAYILIGNNKWKKVGSIGQPAVGPLIMFLENTQLDYKDLLTIIRMFGEIGNEAAVQPLSKIFRNEQSWNIRVCIAKALNDISKRDSMAEEELKIVLGKDWKGFLDGYVLIDSREWQEIGSIGSPAVQPLVEFLEYRWNEDAAAVLKGIDKVSYAEIWRKHWYPTIIGGMIVCTMIGSFATFLFIVIMRDRRRTKYQRL